MSNAQAITKAHQRRFDIITREVGCICCRMKFGCYVEAQANHLLSGYRLGHEHSTPECPWHHQGICFVGTDAKAMRRAFGPSRRLHKKAFRRDFGSDQNLLALTNDYVRAFEAKIVGGGNNESTAHFT